MSSASSGSRSYTSVSGNREASGALPPPGIDREVWEAYQAIREFYADKARVTVGMCIRNRPERGYKDFFTSGTAQQNKARAREALDLRLDELGDGAENRA